MTLAAHERAELLGISLADYVKLGNSDARIVAEITVNARAWHAWLAAGQPDADPSKLVAHVSDGVHRLMAETFATLPTPAAWWACEGVVWIQVGRGIGGQMRVMPTGMRQVIVIEGDLLDDDLKKVFVHELAHAVHACVDLPRPVRHVTAHEDVAIDLAVATMRGDDEKTLIDRLYAGERLANETAATWGYPSIVTDDERIADLRSSLHAARGRAAELVVELQPRKDAA